MRYLTNICAHALVMMQDKGIAWNGISKSCINCQMASSLITNNNNYDNDNNNNNNNNMSEVKGYFSYHYVKNYGKVSYNDWKLYEHVSYYFIEALN